MLISAVEEEPMDNHGETQRVFCIWAHLGDNALYLRMYIHMQTCRCIVRGPPTMRERTKKAQMQLMEKKQVGSHTEQDLQEKLIRFHAILLSTVTPVNTSTDTDTDTDTEGQLHAMATLYCCRSPWQEQETIPVAVQTWGTEQMLPWGLARALQW